MRGPSKESVIIGESLEILCDTRIALLREDGRVFDPRVPPRRHVSYNGLLLAVVRVVVIWAGSMVIPIVIIVVVLGVVHGYGVVARVV